jgi:hypothetical protein
LAAACGRRPVATVPGIGKTVPFVRRSQGEGGALTTGCRGDRRRPEGYRSGSKLTSERINARLLPTTALQTVRESEFIVLR